MQRIKKGGIMEENKGKDKYRRELNFWHVVFLSTGGIVTNFIDRYSCL